MSEQQDWDNFRLAIAAASKELKCGDSGPWFRGVGDSNFRLYPTLLRPRPTGKIVPEAELYRRFASLPSMISARDSWDVLIEMQHRDSPTRLLDWTETLFVALHFAVASWEKSRIRQPAIYVLNPAILSRKVISSNVFRRIFSVDEHFSIPNYDACFVSRTKKWPYEIPIPFEAVRRSDRIRAQRGYFTIHGNNKKPLDAQASQAIRQVRVPLSVTGRIKSYLEYSGIDELFLFPDAEGLARFVKTKYGL